MISIALKKFQEDLGKETLLTEKAKKEKISSGIRELDEMIGGGFTPASMNLIQESLGCGGDILCYSIAKANLNLSNKVLIIYSDPICRYLVDRLKTCDSTYPNGQNIGSQNKEQQFTGKGQECGNNLFILDLVKLTEQDSTLMDDKHEIQIRISNSINQWLKDLENNKDDTSDRIIIYFSLNPFLLKLGQATLDLLYNNLIEATKTNYVQIVLMQKEIISDELKAKIQSMCHLVCDLSAKDVAGLMEHHIRILKHAGTVHDIKAEPYVVDYDRQLNKYSFYIRGAFLTSFETLRNLLKYQEGAIFMADLPYLIAPVDYFNVLLEMPLNLSLDGGKREINEKSQSIGRNITSATRSLYFLADIELFKASLRQLALFGFGNFELITYEKDENLLIVNIKFEKEFNDRSYKLFINGLMEGIVRSALERSVRSVQIIKIEMDESNKALNRLHYKMIVRLSPLVPL